MRIQWTGLLCLGLMACSGGKDDDPVGEICHNGADDDGDGAVDCADPECSLGCGEICDDGVDNDGDGEIDCIDRGCDGQCAETCDDGRDNDLDGTVDCADSDCIAVCPEDCGNLADDDGDGLVDCDDDSCATTCDADGDGVVSTSFGGTDCDDSDPDIGPFAAEVCNDVDDDCDLLIDDADSSIDDGDDYFVDLDGDGYGNPLQRLERCTQPSGTAINADDCDDTNDQINPDGLEVCNLGIDDDCDGDVDDDDASLDTSTLVDWYVDGDGDGWGTPSTPIVQCAQPPNRADNDLDCNDSNASIGGAIAWSLDADGDGVGGGTPTAPLCTSPGGSWVASSLGDDCDDGDDTRYPGALDACNDGIDQDCDGYDFLGCTDTAAYVSLYGEATVSTAAGTYLGTEFHQWAGVGSGWLICEWTWTAMDWTSDPSAVGVNPIVTPCRDPDANLCDWNYTVNLSLGSMTGGSDCAFYGLTAASSTQGGAWGYGWMDDYRIGGTSFGETMMYFYPPFAVWVGVTQVASFTNDANYDPVTGEFDYEWLDLMLFPTP